ncbi:MAG: hypothetical protein Q9167_001070 [Letrouitia subvulpina]
MEASQDLVVHPPINELYRNFSFKLESRISDNEQPNELTLALVEKLIASHFSTPEIAKLDEANNALIKAWARLREKLPAEQRDRIAQGPPRIEDIVSVVRKIEDSWQSEKQKGISGRIKGSFHRFCSGLNSHSNLLGILPSSSHYASVFCGTLQTLIQASANHEKIAEGLSRALQEITETAEACAKDCSMYPTQAMQQGIADLYAHIFLFLKNVIDWYLKTSIKRALASLNEDFYRRFEDEISNIKWISSNINRKADHGARSETRYTRLTVENFQEDTRNRLENMEREMKTGLFRVARVEQEKLRVQEETLKRLEHFHRHIGTSAKVLYLELGSDYESEKLEEARKFKIKRAPKESRAFAENDGKERPPVLQPRAHVLPVFLGSLAECARKEGIQFYSRHLEDSIVSGEITTPDDLSSESFFDLQVVSALEEWTTATASQVLCVTGPAQIKDPCPTTLVASRCLDLAIQSEIPVVSFFCSLPRQKGCSLQHQTRESAALISLTYVMIRQLIKLLPPINATSLRPLSHQRFNLLNGSSDSLEDAINLLGDLLDLAPSMLFCIIDGFQQLDD